MIKVFCVVGWLFCSWVTCGITIAEFQGMAPNIAKDNYRRTVGFAILFSTGGPISLVLSYLISGFAQHGFYFKYREVL